MTPGPMYCAYNAETEANKAALHRPHSLRITPDLLWHYMTSTVDPPSHNEKRRSSSDPSGLCAVRPADVVQSCPVTHGGRRTPNHVI